MDRPSVVLVPGGFTGAWMWADVVTLLGRRGIDAVAVELPTLTEGDAGLDLRADARAVRDALDRLEAPVLLCGHSYGGGVITEAATGPHPAVRHLVYLAAAVPDTGESLASIMRTAVMATDFLERPDTGVTLRADGLAQLDREQARRTLFADCTPERANAGLDQLRPWSLAGGEDVMTGAAWRDLPTTFVRCQLDVMPEAITAAFFERRPELVEIPAGHCANWSRPELVADLLAERALGLLR